MIDRAVIILALALVACDFESPYYHHVETWAGAADVWAQVFCHDAVARCDMVAASDPQETPQCESVMVHSVCSHNDCAARYDDVMNVRLFACAYDIGVGQCADLEKALPYSCIEAMGPPP